MNYIRNCLANIPYLSEKGKRKIKGNRSKCARSQFQ